MLARAARRRGLPADRPRPAGGAPRLPAGARRRAIALTQPRFAASSTGRPAFGGSTVDDAGRRARAARPPRAGPATGGPRLRDLHLRLDRPAQGRDDRPPRRASTPCVDVNRRFGVGAGRTASSRSRRSTSTSRSTTSSACSPPAAPSSIPDAGTRRDPRALGASSSPRERVTIWNSVPPWWRCWSSTAPSRRRAARRALRLVLMSRRLDPGRACRTASARRCPERRGDQHGRRHRGLDLVDPLPDRRGRPGLAEHPVRPADGEPDLPRARRPRSSRARSGSPGDLYIGGIGLAQGYWRDAERTRASASSPTPRPASALYRTGDLGRYLPGGDIEFLGRDDARSRSSGYRIELGEIEAALRQPPRGGGGRGRRHDRPARGRAAGRLRGAGSRRRVARSRAGAARVPAPQAAGVHGAAAPAAARGAPPRPPTARSTARPSPSPRSCAPRTSRRAAPSGPAERSRAASRRRGGPRCSACPRWASTTTSSISAGNSLLWCGSTARFRGARAGDLAHRAIQLSERQRLSQHLGESAGPAVHRRRRRPRSGPTGSASARTGAAKIAKRQTERGNA